MGKTMEDIFFNNLVEVGGHKAWAIMETENLNYLSEDWNTTADKVSGNEDIFLEKLPHGLKEWTEKQLEEQTDIFHSIQRVHTSINHLGQYLIITNIINTRDWTDKQKSNLSKYIGWVWHLLHSEQ